MFDRLTANSYQIEFRNHAAAIIEKDFPVAVAELEDSLLPFEVKIGEMLSGGGGLAAPTMRLRKALNAQGWIKENLRSRERSTRER